MGMDLKDRFQRGETMEYYIGLKLDSYYFVHIFEDGFEEKVMVHEDNIDGFIECLEYFGFRQ